MPSSPSAPSLTSSSTLSSTGHRAHARCWQPWSRYRVHGTAAGRHPIEGVLVIAVCAVAAGARSFASIAEWAGDTASALLAQIGMGTPHASTIRRTLSRMDAETLD